MARTAVRERRVVVSRCSIIEPPAGEAIECAAGVEVLMLIFGAEEGAGAGALVDRSGCGVPIRR